MLARLDALAEAWSHRVAVIGIVGFVAVATVTIVDVLMRWLFNSPIDGVEEVSRLMVAVAIAAFFPLAIAERHHIAITFLGSALGRRGTDWLRALASAVTTFFFVLVGWQFVLYVLEVRDAGETTWILAWPVTPWWAVVTVIMLACIPAQLIVLVVDLGRALGGEPMPERAPSEPLAPGDAEP